MPNMVAIYVSGNTRRTHTKNNIFSVYQLLFNFLERACGHYPTVSIVENLDKVWASFHFHIYISAFVWMHTVHSFDSFYRCVLCGFYITLQLSKQGFNGL